MGFISHRFKLGTILIGLMFPLMSVQPAFARTRLFVPVFRLGAGFDTQLLISNNSDRDTSVDLWAFVKTGRLLGQEQLRIKAHATRSLTLAEAFGSQSLESTGWLAADSDGDGIQMSYNLLGDHTESLDAEAWPKRELALDISEGRSNVVRLSNTSSVANTVTVRRKDRNGGFIGLLELPIGPFQQLELPHELVQESQRIDVLATSDILATLGEIEENSGTGGRTPFTEGENSDETLSLVIDRNTPLGAYQVLLRFDPTLVQFSQDDILGGSAAGFDSKPLAVNVDNAAGELRIASFQIGNEPQDGVDVAHIRVRLLRPSRLQFGITIEEVSDLHGTGDLDSTSSVRIVRTK